MSPQKKRMGQVVKDALTLAHTKGLVVKRNVFNTGWTITLPNGSNYHSPTPSDMVRYIRGY
jgi:hypothetical protein